MKYIFLAILSFSNFLHAGSSSGYVIFNGEVAEAMQPTCDYSALNLNVSIPIAKVKSIPTTLELDNALKGLITSGEIVPNGDASVKNAYQALGTGFGSVNMDVTCKGLTQYFSVSTQSIVNDSTCSSVGCKYLSVRSSDTDIGKNFALSMFISASIYGTGGISTGWVNPSIKGGFSSILSEDGGFPLFYREGVEAKKKNIEFSFVLVKKEGDGPTEWEKSKDTGEYSYNSSIVMQFIYQ